MSSARNYLEQEVMERAKHDTADRVHTTCSLARADRLIGREYHGRFLIELLQNSADAYRGTGTGLAACILVFRETKPEDHRNKVLFIDASREYKTGRAQNELLPEHVSSIHRWHEDYVDVEGVCRVVTLDETRENDSNLNIPRYVEPVLEEETMTVDEAIANCKESLEAAYAAEDRLKDLLQKEGVLG
jgi:hypothetical protein